jgi:hypothetical protein
VWKAQRLALLKLPKEQASFEAGLLPKRGALHLAMKPRQRLAGPLDSRHIMSSLTSRQLIVWQE